MSFWSQIASLAQRVPVGRIVAYGGLALLAGLTAGTLAAWALLRAGLLHRRSRYGRWAARLYFVVLPLVLTVCALQAALVLCLKHTLAAHLQAARPALRTAMQQAVGAAQVQLQALLDQHPELSTVSIEHVVDAVVDQAAHAPDAMGDGALRQLAVAGTAVLGAQAFRETLKDVLAERLQKLAHIDATTTRIALRQSLATLANGEFVAEVLAQRMRAFFGGLYRGIGLHGLFWLALAALEIGFAQWRRRRTSTPAGMPA
ncbi:hypothetical protein [Ralstonia solanacearum]|uniref:Transmembrane protein n=1 Tax=Ralstonia solanacearum TaxID=305 RepID=A0AAD0WG69_RALSL|nr:hypothetical protein [Ralstonia solanacearum]AXV81755.1 hypothetical protein CJO77_09490 [Ralstonia solanacearum]AXW52890.1 hypothetical protein CJO92_09485 [Ralstonia solanacearum]CBJ51369.1 membrane protein of unknown function [Ralstonia solanacearum PSI07]